MPLYIRDTYSSCDSNGQPGFALNNISVSSLRNRMRGWGNYSCNSFAFQTPQSPRYTNCQVAVIAACVLTMHS